MRRLSGILGRRSDGRVARLFGVYDEDTGLALRGTFHLHGPPGSEVCPSKWRDEGDKTLTPSARMVGRVHEALQE